MLVIWQLLTKGPFTLRGLATTLVIICTPALLLIVQINPGLAEQAISKGGPRLAILPFDDQRGSDYGSWGWVSMVPLFPYGHEYADRPEDFVSKTGMSVIPYNPVFSLPNAIAAELRASELFEQVTLTSDASNPEPDFLLKGTLRSTRYDMYVTGYGLSVIGLVSWVLGFPYGIGQNSLDLTLEMVQRENQDRVVWRADIDRTDTLLVSPYYNDEAAQLSYIIFARDAIQEARASLEAWVKNHYAHQ